jgi:short-subunit dehydrogenase
MIIYIIHVSQHGYFDALRAEVQPHNISVSIICPGPVESEIADHAYRDPKFPVQVTI